MRDAHTEAGFTLIEAVVSLLVFAILSTGLVAGTGAIVRLIADSRARVVATALAAQDISLVRAVGDPFALAGATGEKVTTTTQLVGTRTYTVERTVHLVSRSGDDVACNTSTDLFYARVNVRVTWTGKAPTTTAVTDDTVVAANGRINDSATGSISVTVYGADGSPRSGVSVTVTPLSGGAVLAAQPAATDSNGCTRIGGVTPGTYTTAVARTGYLGINQESAPSATVIVTAGTNQSLSVQYDQAATFGTSYVPWPTSFTATTPIMPSSLSSTFLNTTSGPYVTSSTAASVKLHPFASGYTAVAGTPADANGAVVCAAVDPTAWSAGTSGTKSLAAGVRASAATGPGLTTAFTVASGSRTAAGIPMGILLVSYGSNAIPAGTVFTATTTVLTGNPTCTTSAAYTFTTTADATRAALQLPFGSYSVSYRYGSNTGSVPAAYLSTPTNVVNQVNSSGVATLDPRAAG